MLYESPLALLDTRTDVQSVMLVGRKFHGCRMIPKDYDLQRLPIEAFDTMYVIFRDIMGV